jgi:hypothetical protein
MLLLLSACFVNEYPPPDPLPAEYTSCEVDEDCVVVSLGCCDHCNGGEARAANTANEDEVRDLYSERCGPRYSCTLMGCSQLEATCAEGTCTLGTDDTGL